MLFILCFIVKSEEKMTPLKISTFSSLGRCSRIYSYKTKEIHYLLSDNQLRVFLLLEWCDKIMDIKSNQYMENLEEYLSERIENLRLDKFKSKESEKIYDLYTSFLITVDKNTHKENIAISVKNSSNLNIKTTIEKLEIERRYWGARGIKFYIITEKEINKVKVNNISWCREALIEKSIKNKNTLALELYEFIIKNKDKVLDEVLVLFDDIKNIEDGTSLFLFRYLIAIKKIEINMKEKIILDRPISDIIISFRGDVYIE